MSDDVMWHGPLERLTWQAIDLAAARPETRAGCRAIFESKRADVGLLVRAGASLAVEMGLDELDTAIALADVTLAYRGSETWLRWLDARCSS